MSTAHEPIDLNLLRVLDVLLEERGVTRAAVRLGMTQSAVSHALSRLRTSLGDPLLVRTPQGMIPTARAETLAGPLHAALAGVERALTDGEARFDPKTTKRTFTISTADYAGFVLLPRLAARLEQEAPNIDLVILPSTNEPIEPLENGALDLCIGLKKHARAGIRLQHLLEDRFVTIVRKDHPAVSRGRRMTLDTYVELSHILISPHGRGRVRGFVDEALAEHNRTRRVALVLPHFLVAPHVVAETDLVLTVTKRVADRFAEFANLRLLEPPLEIPGFDLHQLWHERLHEDPAHAWLRRTIAEVAKKI
jgi:DNA-binding transcriptional LysR family regulator